VGHYNLANIFWRTGKVDQAVAQYQEALRLNPHLTQARDRLAQIQQLH